MAILSFFKFLKRSLSDGDAQDPSSYESPSYEASEVVPPGGSQPVRSNEVDTDSAQSPNYARLSNAQNVSQRFMFAIYLH